MTENTAAVRRGKTTHVRVYSRSCTGNLGSGGYKEATKLQAAQNAAGSGAACYDTRWGDSSKASVGTKTAQGQRMVSCACFQETKALQGSRAYSPRPLQLHTHSPAPWLGSEYPSVNLVT